MRTKSSVKVFLYSLFLLFCYNAELYAFQYKIKTVVIDAGHGGKDGATHGAFSKEKDVALATALELGKTIEAEIPGVKVVYTRTEDVFVPLYERIGLANKVKADLFISIHCNSMPFIKSREVVGYKKRHGKKHPVYQTHTSQSTGTNGVETFVAGFGRLDEQDVAIQENASILLEDNYKDNYEGFDPNDPESYIVLALVKNSFREQSIKLAAKVQAEYINVGRIDRGVKEKNLAVLARASMPAILTEIGFISNPEEEFYLNSDVGRKEVAMCITTAIKKYKTEVEGIANK